MSERQLILLSPYRFAAESTLYLSDEEIASILNGHQALWHPACLALAGSLPKIAQPYEHEEPIGQAIYALPDNPPLMLADDWHERAGAAGAIVFTTTNDRATTFEHLREALRQAGVDAHLDLDEEVIRPFLGIGFGCGVLEALFEAMSHENVLASSDVLHDLREALAHLNEENLDTTFRHLQSAADRLLAAREVLYPVSVYLVDLAFFPSEPTSRRWPAAYVQGQPFNLLASAQEIEQFADADPDGLRELREKVSADLVEVVGTGYLEREDPLLPIESQIWNLLHGQRVYRERLEREVRVHARRRFGFHPQTPLFLQHAGFTHSLFVSFDDGQLPSYSSIVVSWPSHNGKQVDAFTRAPLPADSPQTYFHLAHHLHQTIMQDQSATLVLLHKEQPASPWYEDWLALTRLAPVLGRWVTLSSYFGEVVAGDYTAPISADEFSSDYLSERTASTFPSRDTAISEFARLTRARRRVDAAWTFTSILRCLGSQVEDVEGVPFLERLQAVELDCEQGHAEGSHEMQIAATALARRLVASGPSDSPGWMLLNPCAFTRRVAVELEGLEAPIPAGGPVKACQLEGSLGRLVVEVPPLGFAWVPRRPGAGTPLTTRIKLADERAVRNEFFEAEIDPQTGGLRDLRDVRTRSGRLGQQLVWNPGSTMRATRIETTSTGPALGEIISEGVLLDEGKEIAGFRQRFRAWLGRPMLEMTITIEPREPLEGYPWHSFFGARFAWRNEAAMLVRSTMGMRSLTSQNRPETPDYLEVRVGRQNAVIFPGGLPFHQRHGSRMLDVILLCEGERERTFELGISLDREQPMQTALGVVSPIAVVETEKGPPRVGAAGWLFHVDATNLLLTSLRPVSDHPDGMLATLLECNGTGGPVQFRCVRDPVRATIQELSGTPLIDATVVNDVIDFEVSANDLLQLRIDFS